MRGLPEGWVSVTVSELAHLITKGTTPTSIGFGFVDEGIRFVKVESLLGSIIIDERCAAINKECHAVLKRSQLEIGDILFSIAGTLARIAIVSPSDVPANTNQAIAIIRLKQKNLTPYVKEYLASQLTRDQLFGQGRGTGLQNLNLKQVGNIRVALPPEREQLRIVATLDRLSERTRRAREELSHIPRLIENYKKGILKAAFNGEWFGQTWDYVDFSELVASAQNGLSKRGGDQGSPFNVMRLSDLSDGRFIGEAPRSILLGEKEIKKYSLETGDLVCIRVNGSERLVGRMLVWSHHEKWAFCDHFIRFKLHNDIADADFVSWYFSTDHVRRQIETTFVSSAGQKTVSQRILGAIKVPLPNIEAQRETVKQIEKAMKWLSVVETEQGLASNLLDHLDQANLAKAFRGELVPQDPNDEPASVLLERIRKERAGEQPNRRTRRSRSTTGQETTT